MQVRAWADLGSSPSQTTVIGCQQGCHGGRGAGASSHRHGRRRWPANPPDLELAWGAASGFAAALAGAAAIVFERGPLMASDPAATVVGHLTSYRAPMMIQSMLFLAGAALYRWYLGSLRSFLARAEGGTGRLSMVAFGAGMIWVGINMVAQAFQIGLAANPRAGAGPR